MADLSKLLKSIEERRRKKEEREKIKKINQEKKEKEKEKKRKERAKEREKERKRKEKIKELEKEKKRKKREKERKKVKAARLKNKKRAIKRRRIKREKLREIAREEKQKKILEEKIERKNRKSYFKIIVTSRNKICETIKSTYFEENAIEYFNEARDKANSTVVFPMKYRNTFGKIVEAKNELLLVQKIDEESQSTFLKNQYGKYIENIVVDKLNYIIVDKCEYPIEETFFVYGYHPYYERKTFDFIYNEMIKNDAYEYVSVVCFKNKLVIEYDYDMNIVICKNIDDCIRLYNTLNDRCLSEKITKAVFKGQITFKSSLYKGIIHKIMEKTGWKETKVCRASTRP